METKTCEIFNERLYFEQYVVGRKLILCPLAHCPYNQGQIFGREGEKVLSCFAEKGEVYDLPRIKISKSGLDDALRRSATLFGGQSMNKKIILSHNRFARKSEKLSIKPESPDVA